MMLSTRSLNRVSPNHHPGLNGFLVARSTCLGLARLIAVGLPASLASAAPLFASPRDHTAHDIPGGREPGGSLMLYLASACLVLLGGAFAGLTIALMGQDSIYLRVVSKDPSEPQQRNAGRVFDLLQKGKHWVLVTLLLSNVVVNETLPVVLDRCLGGGVAAVVGSTVLIVIFGEVLPQSVCVRYGLQIGGCMSGPVLILMYLLAPIAWPTAKLLDHMLGEDHGTVYKKSGLKTLVTLHKSLGEVSERLNQDEVTIISAVLDLKEKPVGEVMTPMEDVFTMAEDTVLDETTMDMILSAGYSRIPIHETGNPANFVGMLLVKILITYDPEDAKMVREFPLATLPETRPETSCLDIINFFQQGSSHLVLVSEYPGEDHGALGVVTLEDVIEELIGEEIIDESDVYIDVHKAIRRLAPAPKARVMRRASESVATPLSSDCLPIGVGVPDGRERELPTPVPGPLTTTWLRRGASTGGGGGGGGGGGDVQSATKGTFTVRANLDDIKPHLSHLGPKNSARNPRPTNSLTVKVKPGTASQLTPRAVGFVDAEGISILSIASELRASRHHDHDGEGDCDETAGLLSHGEPQAATPAAITAKDGVQALSRSYGSVGSGISAVDLITGRSKIDNGIAPSTAARMAAARPAKPAPPLPKATTAATEKEDLLVDIGGGSSAIRLDMSFTTRGVRTGSISETVLETRGGVRKIVLEASSSTEDDDGGGRAGGSKDGERERSLGSRGSARSGSSGSSKARQAVDGAPDEGGGAGSSTKSNKAGTRGNKKRKGDKKP